MDSIFKAAVCDLDKLLDDFELSSDELDGRPVFLKSPTYPFPNPECLPSHPTTVTQSIPDLNALHYGSADGWVDGPGAPTGSSHDSEAAARPLTGVDLLSSVDRGGSQTSAPPCPDRALKPVCDLVNDTGSALLVRTNSHDPFVEPETPGKQQEEVKPVEEEEALLVDFDSPVITEESRAVDTDGGADQSFPGIMLELSNGYSVSLSLLDIIPSPAVEERANSSNNNLSTPEHPVGEQQDSDDTVSSKQESRELESMDRVEEKNSESKKDNEKDSAVSPVVRSEDSDSGPVGLSCLPLAVSACGALVNSGAPGDPSAENTGPQEGLKEALDSTEDSTESRGRQEQHNKVEDVPEVRPAPEGQHVPTEPAAIVHPTEDPETSPVETQEFGFEYLPESDQARLLVTDEELDAFLRAHAEAEQCAAASCTPAVHVQSKSDEPEEQGPRICSQADSNGGAFPESDRAAIESPQGSSDPAPSPVPESSSSPRQPNSPVANHSSSTLHSPDQPSSYGGARPKKPHCHPVRPSPSIEDDEAQCLRRPLPTLAENDESPVDEHPSFRGSSPQYVTRELQDYSPDYEELSEPPPYPGELPSDSAGSSSWGMEGLEELGTRQPEWVPDAQAPTCMNCDQRFTFTKRRHHCRACGKVYCTVCCSRKSKLKYLDKEARVCVICFHIINTGQALERMMSPTGPSPNPNVPSEYCSTIPPLQQARAAGTLNSPPPTVMVPVSVLKQPNSEGCPREQKRVWFADGILPNGEVADTTKLSVTTRRSSQEFISDDADAPGPGGSEVSASSTPATPAVVEVSRPPVSGPWDYALLSGIGSLVRRVPSLLPENEDELPPLLIFTGEGDGGDLFVEESPAPCQILHLLEERGPRPLMFVLNANLLVNVKLVTYSGRHCWCFGSNGLQALGQKELVFLLECLPEEKALPRDLFSLYLSVYQDAQKGKFVEELDNVTFTSSFLNSKDHGGMLFFAHSCQPLEDLTLPQQPFLFGVLIHKLEVPWAKVFPLRLLLRLGAQYEVYPTAMTSIRFRDSVYRETGHTIMNLLADLRNYQYSLPVVAGLRIHMEMGHSYIDIPNGSFNEIQKVLNASNEHVISIGANFSAEADSHLVCFQNEEGNYQTQANSMPGKTRTVTGASFVVFNGALKASSGFIAKSSIVEDGLMVQIPPETMESLRSALREQTDFHIPCGKSDGGEVRENVSLRWVDWTLPGNTGKTSGVDGRALDTVSSVRMLQDAEFESDGCCIKCTEVFYTLKCPDSSLTTVLSSCSSFQKEIALATCSALSPHLTVLSTAGINVLFLRVSTQPDMVEYQAGSGGRLLPQHYMNEMDSALIPVIHGGGASVPQTAMDMEFVFYITHAI